MKSIGILGMFLVATSVLWADGPTVTLNRVQQRYPWNGMVDIDYTVNANGGEYTPEKYYLRFTFTENGKDHVLRSFLDTSKLKDAAAGTHRATWNSEGDASECHVFAKNASLKAELVFDNGTKEGCPYGTQYLVITLSGNPFPVQEMTVPDPSIFNAPEYKTEKLVLRCVSPGTFRMGRSDDDVDWATYDGGVMPAFMSEETPHQVTLTEAFYLGIFEVTQGQWARVMGSGDPNGTAPATSVAFESGMRGGNSVAYGDVTSSTFAGQLNAKTGRKFDLPTEAQWEYACRAGTTSCTYAGAYGSGLGEIAVFGSYSSCQPVGTKLPNDWGFYDMLGNAWEYCRDRITSYQQTGGQKDDYGSAAQTDPVRSVTLWNPALRGGCCDNNAASSRAACRTGANPGNQGYGTVGFRISYMPTKQ